MEIVAGDGSKLTLQKLQKSAHMPMTMILVKKIVELLKEFTGLLLVILAGNIIKVEPRKLVTSGYYMHQTNR